MRTFIALSLIGAFLLAADAVILNGYYVHKFWGVLNTKKQSQK